MFQVNIKLSENGSLSVFECNVPKESPVVMVLAVINLIPNNTPK